MLVVWPWNTVCLTLIRDKRFLISILFFVQTKYMITMKALILIFIFFLLSSFFNVLFHLASPFLRNSTIAQNLSCIPDNQISSINIPFSKLVNNRKNLGFQDIFCESWCSVFIGFGPCGPHSPEFTKMAHVAHLSRNPIAPSRATCAASNRSDKLSTGPPPVWAFPVGLPFPFVSNITR